MNALFFPFVYEKVDKKKELELIPLHIEVPESQPLPVEKPKEEVPRIVIIQL